MAFNTPSCPNCGTLGVTWLHGKNRVRYLANVASYKSGHFFRSVHTNQECTEAQAKIEAVVSEALTAKAESEALAVRANRSQAYVARFRSIFGPEAVAASADKIVTRWMTF